MYCFFNAIVLLRFLNVTMLFWLLLRVPAFLEQIKQWKEYFAHKQSFASPSSAFPSPPNVSLFFPLGSVRLETIRLNEMFAKASTAFRCRERKKAPIVVGKGAAQTFFLCNDFGGENGYQQKKKSGREKTLLIIGDRKIEHFRQNAEKEVKGTTGEMEKLDKIGEKLLLWNYAQLAGKGSNGTSSESKPKKSASIGLIKMEIYSANVGDKNKSKMGHLIEQIEWSIERLKVRHLLLVLRPTAYADANNEDAHSAVLFDWYRFVHKLFFKWHFAILGSSTSGSCGQALQKSDMKHCEWGLSFVRFEHFGQVEGIPCFGSGSPLEEKLRLLHFLLKDPNKNCAIRGFSSADLPFFCSPHNGINFQKIFYVRHRNFLLETDERKVLAKLSKFAEEGATIVLLRPSLASSDGTAVATDFRINSANGSKNCVLSNAIANVSLLPTDQKLGERHNNGTTLTVPSKHFDTFLGQIVHAEADCWGRTALLLDLDGFEWQLLERSSRRRGNRCAAHWVHGVGQLSLRIRLWKMEESDNWRRFYLLLLRLAECGEFERVFSRQIDKANIQIVYRKAQL